MLVLGLIGCSGQDAGKPNVLLISLDTLRPDHLGSYGYRRDTSPFLDRLAREGTRFERAFTNALATPPSHVTLFASQYQQYHRVEYVPESDPFHEAQVPVRSRMLQEVLAEHGYLTLAVTGGGYVSADFGFERGFHDFDDRGGGIEVETERLLSMIERNQREGRPIGALLHTYEIHWPYESPDQYQEMFGDSSPLGTSRDRRWNDHQSDTSEMSGADIDLIVSNYDRGIRHVDDALSAFWDRLERTGFLQNAVVVITADHGEEFGEHGHLNHRGYLYDEHIRVPLIFWGQSIGSGITIDRLAGTVDVVPTILSLAGIEPEDSLQGSNLLASTNTGAYVFSQFGKARMAVRGAEWKLIQSAPVAPLTREVGFQGVVHELYDLVSDPREQSNLAEERPDVVTLMGRELDAWADAYDIALRRHELQGHRAFSPRRELTQFSRLRRLGYLEAGDADGIGNLPSSSPPPSILGRFDAVNGDSSRPVELLSDDRIRAFGWAASASPTTSISAVALFLDGREVARTEEFHERPDVAKHYNNDLYLTSGWTIEFQPPELNGRHRLEAKGISPSGEFRSLGIRTILVPE